MFINRETAIAYLNDAIESGYFSEGFRDSMKEIAECIEAEQRGIHLWGTNGEPEDDLIYTPSNFEVRNGQKRRTFERDRQ